MTLGVAAPAMLRTLMYDPATDLMRALARNVALVEAFADELREQAAAADHRGEPSRAIALTARGRQYRVHVMQLRAQLGALEDEHGALHLG